MPETPPSSSSDFGDSKYGEDPAAQTCLPLDCELERDHPEITPTQPEHPTREAAPPLVEGYRQRCVEPMAARVSPSGRGLFDELTRIFYASSAGEATPWSTEKLTWLQVTRSWYLSQVLVSLPSQMAVLADRLVYVYPAGIMVFYTDVQAVHLYRTGNEAIPTSVGSAISLLRQKLGICCLIFARRRVGILETLTHPRQTRHGAAVRSVVEEAAAGLPQRRRRRRWQKF